MAAAAANSSNPFTKAQIRRWQRKVARASQEGQPAPFGAAPLPSNPFQSAGKGGAAAPVATPPTKALETQRKELQAALDNQPPA
eukprot:5749254-Amphidinium_carterae.1